MKLVAPLLSTVVLASSTAMAAEPAPRDATTSAEATDIRADIPIVAHTYSATGARPRSIGAQAYGLAAGASGQNETIGGGMTVWGSPIDRLTIVADGQRNVFGDFTPSVAGVIRLLGERENGWALGALGKFKVDGFASGPTKDEVESEIEGGVLLSFARRGWHFDLNGITGFGTGDEGEIDGEGRLRLGRDIGSYVRVGVDGQARLRVAGPKYLPNQRTWDFAIGPQLLVGAKNVFGSVTVGPATMGAPSGDLGWTALLSMGGATF